VLFREVLGFAKLAVLEGYFLELSLRRHMQFLFQGGSEVGPSEAHFKAALNWDSVRTTGIKRSIQALFYIVID
jgi:hypothetical protein